jgi:hypothetical protein
MPPPFFVVRSERTERFVMNTLMACLSTLVLGLAVVHAAESVVPPSNPADSPESPTATESTDATTLRDRERSGPRSVPEPSRDRRRGDASSSAKKTIEEKTAH